MRRTVEAPLTYGQLSLLRSLEYNSRFGPTGFAEATFPRIWTIKSTVDVRMVRQAWLQLVLHNESLRTVYDWSGPSPVQIVQPWRMSAIDTVELPEDTFDKACDIAYGLAANWIDMASEWPWRAVIATHEGRPRYLVLALHHVAVDDLAIGSLYEQFEQVLDGRPAPRGPQPVELAAAQADPVTERAVLDYWRAAWPGFVAADRAGNDASVRVQAVITSRVAMTAAAKLAVELAISVQAVVLGVTCAVLARVKGRDAMTLSLMASNRFDRRWEKLVSSMNQNAPLTVRPRPDADLRQFLRDVYTASLEAYSHGAYHIDRLRELLVEDGADNPDPMEFDCYFNFAGAGLFGQDDEPRATGSVQWQKTNRQTGPVFNLVIGTGESLHLLLRASHNYLPPERMAAFLVDVEAMVVDLVERAPRTLAEVDWTPRRSVSLP